MHEWALADAVCKTAQDIATTKKLKQVDEISVVLGQVQNIKPKVMDRIFEEVKLQYTSTKSAKLTVEVETAELKCNKCSNIFGIDDRASFEHQTSEDMHFIPETARLFLKCDKCKSSDFHITKGRGLYIKEIKGETI